MCGIAGYSMTDSTNVDTNMLIRVLLAGLAERGEDASGFAARADHGTVISEKRAKRVEDFLEVLPMDRPVRAADAIVHVRDHTKGLPDVAGNNHPIHHGRICGVHNGVVQNDDHLFDHFGRKRALPGMSVDSEAIFMLLDYMAQPRDVFSELVGSYAVAWFDDEQRESLFVARGSGRPLFLTQLPNTVIFASTEEAIQFAAHVFGVQPLIAQVPEGTFFELRHGRIVQQWGFDVRAFDEKELVEYDYDSPQAHRARLKVLEEAFGGTLPENVSSRWLAG